MAVSRRNAVPSLVRQGSAATGSGVRPCRRVMAILQSPAPCARRSALRSASRRPARGVPNGAVPGGLGCHAVAQLHHRRMPMLRAMMAHGSPCCPGHWPGPGSCGGPAEQVAGEKPVRHQYAGPLQVQAAARAAVQDIHHAAADVLHIDAALTDILVVDVAQPPGKDLPARSTAAAPPAPRLCNRRSRGKGLVLQQRDLEQQNVGVGAFGALTQPAQLVLGQHHGHVVQRALAERSHTMRCSPPCRGRSAPPGRSRCPWKPSHRKTYT